MLTSPAPTAVLDHERILSIAERARKFLEPRWHHWHVSRCDTTRTLPAIVSTGMCRYSSLFLRMALETETEGAWVIRGGAGGAATDEDAAGYLMPDGSYQGHYWVETLNGEIVVDITADQFGGDKVCVARPDLRRLSGYSPSSIECHLKFVRDQVGAWFQEYLETHGLSVKNLSDDVEIAPVEPTF